MQYILRRMSKNASLTHMWGPQERLSDFPHSSTSDQVSQLYQDTLAAFATICEWKNSFSPINRMPLDILSLIPTHLASRKDRFRASFVCRHWRRTLLQRAELWSELFLSMESVEDDVKILLERAKGHALDIHISRGIPVNTALLLSSHTTRFKHLYLSYNTWEYIWTFSEMNYGPLPLLHTLEIVATDGDILEDPGTVTPSFRNAVNLEVFRLYSDSKLQPSLSRFIFPNLTLFDFSMGSLGGFHAPPLLDFLEMSPLLRTVHMKIGGFIFFGGASLERVVTLPNVEYFDLTLGRPNYKIAAHISCPSARRTLLNHENKTANAIEGMFPSSTLWNAIVRQYTTGPVEEVILETKSIYSVTSVTCNLTFRSRDAAAIKLGFTVSGEGLFGMSPLKMHNHVLVHSIRTVQNYPQLAGIKRLHLHGGFRSSDAETIEAGQFLRSMGPLDELTLSYCDLWSYFCPFHDTGTGHITGPTTFPPVKELTIAHPVNLAESECAAIIELAESQYAAGRSFERVILRGDGRMLLEILEELRPWVGSVEFYLEGRCDEEWFDEGEEWTGW